MIVKNGKEAHPLRQSRITKTGQDVFILNAEHDRSWFVIDLEHMSGGEFVRETSND